MHRPFLSSSETLMQGDIQLAQKLYEAAGHSGAQTLAGKPLPLGQRDIPFSDNEHARYLYELARLQTGHAPEDLSPMLHPAFNDRLHFARGQYYFKQKDWTAAAAYFEQAGIENLSNEEVAEAKFFQAYALFNLKRFDEAETMFASIKDINDSRSVSAKYYYGLLAYHKGRYDEALENFQQIEKQDPGLISYYIAEIYYFKGARKEALSKAREGIALKPKSYYDKEFHLLAGQCLFEDKKYAEALPYFEHYYNSASEIRKQDLFEMAYCYYQTKSFANAGKYFKQLSSVQDSLGQAAMYYLGDCSLHSGDKQAAKSAFILCSEMNYDEALTEQALLLSGKLAYELGDAREAEQQLHKLTERYAQTAAGAEARSILSDRLLRSGNFSEAYKLLKSADERDEVLLQKAAYLLGLQHFRSGDFAMADEYLSESLYYSRRQEYSAAAHFWRAEAAYRLARYDEVLAQGTAYLAGDNPRLAVSAAPNASPAQANLTMGYAAMEKENFASAGKYFAAAKKASGFSSGKLAAEAELKEADAAFLEKDYAGAIKLYDRVIAQNGEDADYARFQKSTLLGLTGQSAARADLLLEMVAQKNPPSKFKYEAHYALGDMLLEANKFEDAIAHFQKVNDGTAQHLAAKALMKIGFAYSEAENDERAAEAYATVVKQYPASEQKPAALEALRNIYVAQGKPDAYVQFLKTNNLESISKPEMDSLYYQAGENKFAAGKYAEASAAMERYLKEYPQGNFKVQALFYAGQSLQKTNRSKEALAYYESVLNMGWSDFTAPAATEAGAIALQSGDGAQAEKYYAMLRNSGANEAQMTIAFKGLMEAAYKRNELALAAARADTLLHISGLSASTAEDAHLMQARYAYTTSDFAGANTLLLPLKQSARPEVAGEAAWMYARNEFKLKTPQEAETAARQAISETGNTPYWNAKSYLLMAEVFVAQGDWFNAKATLQSIIKNVKTEALRKEAEQALEQVKKSEKTNSKLSDR